MIKPSRGLICHATLYRVFAREFLMFLKLACSSFLEVRFTLIPANSAMQDPVLSYMVIYTKGQLKSSNIIYLSTIFPLKVSEEEEKAFVGTK